MAITYNPYGWKIRPREPTLDEYKQRIEKLEEERANIIDIIQFHISTDQNNWLIGKYISDLHHIQERIEILRIRCHMESEVYMWI